MRLDPDHTKHAEPADIPHIAAAVRPERIVVVASGKGGVGTSVCASLLALACAGAGKRTLLIDGNEGNGTLHHLFGLRPTSSLDALRDPRVPVFDVCMELGDRFTLVASKPASSGQLHLSAAAQRAPFERLLPLSADYDCVVVDAGSRLDSMLAVATAGARRAVLVTDADRISLAATFAMIKILSIEVPTLQCGVLVNRHDEAVGARAGEHLIGAASRFLNVALPIYGCIPDDACLRAAIGAGMPIGDAAQESPAAAAVQPVALNVFPSHAGARSSGPASLHPRQQS